jgi:quinol monooxygenase YgiN
MIRVITTVNLKEGKRKDYLKEMNKIMPMVHIETGCIEYAPYIDADYGIPEQQKLGDNTITIIERWQGLKALKKHNSAPHMNSFRQATKELIQSTQMLILTTAN